MQAPSTRDHVLIQQTVIDNPGVTAEEVTREMFSKETAQETKMRVTYFAPPKPSSLVYEAEGSLVVCVIDTDNEVEEGNEVEEDNEVDEMAHVRVLLRDHVKNIKESWAITGCSILMDSWVDQKGRELVALVAFAVDSPAGEVPLDSFDVSAVKHDFTALKSLVEGVIDEVGVENVIQIIASSSSGWVGDLGKFFATINKDIFWFVSVSHCFKIMLAKISEIHSLGPIDDKIRQIKKYMENNHLKRLILTLSCPISF